MSGERVLDARRWEIVNAMTSGRFLPCWAPTGSSRDESGSGNQVIVGSAFRPVGIVSWRDILKAFAAVPNVSGS
ncbi:hypothetical protein LJ655_13635 [Paraburkholderia sp. MMS20-SJTN17]|uniref:CBS domain-containing protein n=1 Tax=Paraburkholderia translucens TaxID=2886945 RepID=A0ABS8KEN7_9BURK|nr:hypothetical protein [Paraburkholderia sp. MMS20-SJTN17]MCC8402914.1 hypothetical protein [Paraburkholderia sp. MMS20-SJTN17]